MKISIIIPTCNRPRDLFQCIGALIPQILETGSVEIIVCDDGRSDHVRDSLANQFPSVRYLQGPQRGPAANRNAGAQAATSLSLIFLDDDCLPNPNYITSYIRWLDRNDLPTLYAVQGPTLREKELPSLLWEAPHNPLGEARISANFMIPKNVYLQAGTFDERFPLPAYEDTEFFSRLECMGGQIFFDSDAFVRHPLRKIPGSKKLASRWEGKVIIALDQGASPLSILFRLPWHVLRVIQSRFRGESLSMTHLKAMWLFVREWILVCLMTPYWVFKWNRQPRSPFWRDYVQKNGPVPNHGF